MKITMGSWAFLMVLIPIVALAQSAVSDADKQKAGDAYIDCLVKATHLLDDGHSDAATIAKATTLSCIRELDRSSAAYSADMAEPMRREYSAEMKKWSEAMAIQIVLGERHPERNSQ